MTKKRKLSDLSSQEVDLFLKIIENFKGGLNEEDEEEKSVIASLDHVVAKIVQVQHVPFSSATALTFLKAKIKAGPLTLMLNKTPDITKLGLAGTDLGLTVDQTKALLSLIRAHVSFSSEAGCRVLVNIILLHVVSKISGTEVDVSIVPEFRMDATRFEYAATSYGGVVDYLIVKGPPAAIKFLLGGPQLAFTDPDNVKLLSSNIYEAKKDGFRDAIPQAAMAAASYCRQHNLLTFRGCVTNGETWVFFVFNVAESGEGGTVSISDEFRLNEDFSGLPLILGLLSDWIINAKEREQQFFTY